jgi:hypothetical protein
MDLVCDKWWTEEDVTIGADGTCTVRGFPKNYRVSAAGPSGVAVAELTLVPGGSDVRHAAR